MNLQTAVTIAVAVPAGIFVQVVCELLYLRYRHWRRSRRPRALTR